jgi:hypothetical protein
MRVSPKNRNMNKNGVVRRKSPYPLFQRGFGKFIYFLIFILICDFLIMGVPVKTGIQYRRGI